MSKLDRSEWTSDDLVGGHPVLDFLNSAGGRTKLRDMERLTDFPTFLWWTVAADVLSEQEARDLHARAQDDADAAQAVLADTRRFREVLHRCLMAKQADLDWPEPERSQVMDAIRQALWNAHLESDGDTYRWVTSAQQSDLKLPKVRIVLLLEALLRSDDLARMRNCDRCSWLFIDRGRGRARRWCSMAACGSRAKSAKYYSRKTTKSE
ncbi:CGNR zinc finger domain-containing protein [Sagittula sp. NFXS13]|uniref:CGNR zinc finger domain-containing protein n=1 Tax=Sagittula sp. NFXS13 TaxID=2819095 RepID=UPI0032DF4F59